MNSRITLALLAAVGAAAALPAHASYVSGDLLVGFGKTGAANDYIFDVGSFSSIASGEQWNLSSGLYGTFGGLSNLNFGVVGALNLTKTIYSTTDGSFSPAEIPNGFNTIRADIAAIGQNSTANSSVTLSPSVSYSWSYETLQPPGTPGGILQNDLDNPNVTTPVTFDTGSKVAYFYSSDNLGDAATLAGNFSLSANGVLTFTAVPEPTGCCLLGLGLLALRLRIITRVRG